MKRFLPGCELDGVGVVEAEDAGGRGIADRAVGHAGLVDPHTQLQRQVQAQRAVFISPTRLLTQSSAG